jgi:hypothetical protein
MKRFPQKNISQVLCDITFAFLPNQRAFFYLPTPYFLTFFDELSVFFQVFVFVMFSVF